MSDQFPWYEIIEGNSLEQGDILFRMPILEIPEDFEWPESTSPDEIELNPNLKEADVVIITQTCDLEQGKVKQVALCNIVELSEHPKFPETNYKLREELRRGNIVHYHLLDQCTIKGHEHDFFIVEFTELYSLPINLVKHLARKQGKRLRLLSPYKEHLSQAFARVFMRVGLPSTISPFEKPKKKG